VNWRALLLGGPNLATPERYRSFAPHLERDATTLRSLFDGLKTLEAQFDAALTTVKAVERGYFSPEEDDMTRRMLLSYRNFRLATYSAVWRYVFYASETDQVVQLKGFVLGYAAAASIFSRSLKLIQAVDANPLVRSKLNEPDERFGIEAGFFDNVIETHCSTRFLTLFAVGDRFWRKNRKNFKKLGIEDDPEYGFFIDQIRELRRTCWQHFWPAIKKRLRYESRSTFRMLFAPVRMTGYGAQTLLGHTVARMRTTLDYVPAMTPSALDYLRERLQPGDLLFTRTEHKVTTALLPGFFAHVAIYLGSLEEMKQRGLLSVPAVQKALPAMLETPAPRGWVLEAKHPGVIVQPLEACLECDHVFALRPTHAGARAEKVIAEAFEHLGKPYDFTMDFSRTSHLVCTELVFRVLNGQGPYHFDLIKRMGRYTLTVDDIVRQYLSDIGNKPDAWLPVALMLQVRDSALPVALDAANSVLGSLVTPRAANTVANTAEAAPAEGKVVAA
jgi:hypothetical protein